MIFFLLKFKIGSRQSFKFKESLSKRNSKSPLAKKRSLIQEYITLSPKNDQSCRTNSKILSRAIDYNYNSYLQDKSIFEKFKFEKSHETKLQRELFNIGKILGRNTTPIKSNRNKPIINVNKPELSFSYQSYFHVSPNKSRKSALSSSKAFKNVHMNYNFTNKINNEFKIKKYSKNNVLMLSKSIKPNDSFDDFVKGNLIYY